MNAHILVERVLDDDDEVNISPVVIDDELVEIDSIVAEDVD